MSGRHVRRRPLPVLLAPLALVVVGGLAVSRMADPRGRALPGASGPPTPSAGVSARTPPPTPRASPSPGPVRERIIIHATGDVSLDPSYVPALHVNGYGWAWSGLGGLFRGDDLTVINLECPATTIVAPIPKTYSFRCDPAALDDARRAGVEVASLANNHAFDQGPQGLLDPIRNLRRAGILPIGAGRGAARADAPRYVEVGGWRVGLVGVAEVIDPDVQVGVVDRVGTAVGHDFPRAGDARSSTASGTSSGPASRWPARPRRSPRWWSDRAAGSRGRLLPATIVSSGHPVLADTEHGHTS